MADMFDGITKVMYGSTEMMVVKTVDGNNTYYPYVKAYTYSTGSKTGVNTITCTRASSPYKGAATGTVANGGTLYYGDTFYITCSSQTGYTASSSLSSSNTATVSANVTGSSYTSASINSYTFKINKGTGISKIYYKTGSSSNDWTESTSNVSISLNYGTEYWWYATAATGYSYSATSSSSPGNGTIGTSNVTLSPAGTRLTYSFTITTSTYVTKFQASTDNANWTEYTSTKTFSNVDYATTYYIKPSGVPSSNAQYTYAWTIGSNTTSTLTYSSHNNIKYEMSRTLNKYSVSISLGTGIKSISYKVGSATSYTTSTSAYSATLDYGTAIAWYATANTGYTYSTYTSSSPYSSTVSGAYSVTATATINTYAVSITAGTGIKTVYTSTTSTATSGNASGTKYNYGSTVYAFVTLSDNTTQYTYTAKSGWTQIGTSRTYRVDSVSSLSAAKDFGTIASTRTTNKYAVTFTAGTYCQNAFTSTSSTATSGNASGTTYDYNTTVYYFITKNANTTQYTYTSTGTNVSGNVYRLGSVTTTSAQALGTIGNVTRTTNQYSVTASATNVTINLYSNSAMTTAFTSGNKVDYGTTIYYKITPNTGYSYDGKTSATTGSKTVTSNSTITASGTRLIYSFTVTVGNYVGGFAWSTDNSTWTNEENSKTFSNIDYATKYYVKPLLPNTSDAQYTYTWTSGSNTTYTRSYSAHDNIKFEQSRTLNSYSVKLTLGTGIASISYKIANATNYTTTTTGYSGTLDYGTAIAWYATANTGYTYSTYTSSSPYSSTVSGAYSVTATATINTYAVTFTAGNYVKSVYTSTSSTATSGNASGTKYSYNSTVYIFATLSDNTASYTYTAPSGWTLVSGRTYRVNSATITAAKNFGTISATRTSNTPTYTFHIMYSYSGMIDPYYICSDVNEFNDMKGIGYEAILTTTVTTSVTSYKMSASTISNLIENHTGGFNYYDGGDITFTLNSSNRDIYLAAHVND